MDQPKPQCISSPAPFAVKLVEQARQESTPGACDSFGPDSFNADPEVGMLPYYERDDKGQPDYDKGSVAIQTAELGTALLTAQGFGADNEAPSEIWSFGAFSGKEPDDDNICTVPTLTTTHLVLPELPEVLDDPETEDDDSFPGQPALDVELEWSDVHVYVTAAVYGTQFDAMLRDTRTAPSGETCTITYKATGLAPAVSCAALDEEGNPITNEDGSVELDPSLCESEPNVDLGRALGSGISPAAKWVCDPVIAFCTVEGDSVPSLK